MLYGVLIVAVASPLVLSVLDVIRPPELVVDVLFVFFVLLVISGVAWTFMSIFESS